MTNIIEARGVVKTYRAGEIQVHALQGIDLSIGRGQMVAVMGPSGSGKTTLLNTFSGIDDVTSGEVVSGGSWVRGKREGHRRDTAGPRAWDEDGDTCHAHAHADTEANSDDGPQPSSQNDVRRGDRMANWYGDSTCRKLQAQAAKPDPSGVEQLRPVHLPPSGR
ncbi:MAG: ATP-binding cassette domain-containing protein [Chloroflexi bacterium]|nr:ATP-binding cassette domain-containing protein [Chloroflexota bacterium]